MAHHGTSFLSLYGTSLPRAWETAKIEIDVKQAASIEQLTLPAVTSSVQPTKTLLAD